MAGRFTARRVAADDAPPIEEPSPSALEGVSWTVFPEASPESAAPVQPAANPLLSDKLLDAKVRLHRRLIEEINLSALEKLPEDEIRNHVQQLVSQYVLVERLALNANELDEFGQFVGVKRKPLDQHVLRHQLLDMIADILLRQLFQRR